MTIGVPPTPPLRLLRPWLLSRRLPKLPGNKSIGSGATKVQHQSNYALLRAQSSCSSASGVLSGPDRRWHSTSATTDAGEEDESTHHDLFKNKTPSGLEQSGRDSLSRLVKTELSPNSKVLSFRAAPAKDKPAIEEANSPTTPSAPPLESPASPAAIPSLLRPAPASRDKFRHAPAAKRRPLTKDWFPNFDHARREVERITNYTFKDPDYIRLALYGGNVFLGDDFFENPQNLLALIGDGLIPVIYIGDNFLNPDASSVYKEYSRIKTNEHMAKIAIRSGLASVALWTLSTLKSTVGVHKMGTLFEAVLGAVFLDSDYNVEAAKRALEAMSAFDPKTFADAPVPSTLSRRTSHVTWQDLVDSEQSPETKSSKPRPQPKGMTRRQRLTENTMQGLLASLERKSDPAIETRNVREGLERVSEEADHAGGVAWANEEDEDVEFQFGTPSNHLLTKKAAAQAAEQGHTSTAEHGKSSEVARLLFAEVSDAVAAPAEHVAEETTRGKKRELRPDWVRLSARQIERRKSMEANPERFRAKRNRHKRERKARRAAAAKA